VTRTLIHNGKLVTPGAGSPETGYVLIEGKRIVDIGHGAPPEALQATRIDAGDGYVGPGFVDVHVHGAAGHDAMDATPEAVRGMAQFKAQHGVTSFLPTTMTDTPEAIDAALANIGACEGEVEGGAAILGAHIEGPYFNTTKRGAQPEAYIRRADPAEYERWFDLCTVKLISIAVEYPEHLAAIAYIRRQGAAVSAGHTDATYEQVVNAIAWGLNHVTHTFNGMSGLHHRTPGVALAALTQDALYAELVCDLHHVHPARRAHHRRHPRNQPARR
jgi:N-acetylglucosamine-6-phosphate deacetylase